MPTLREVVEEVRTEFQRTDRPPPLQWGGTEWRPFSQAVEGWHSGLFWIAGQTNHGKSATIITMVLNLLEYNEDLRVIDFSIDDDRYTRVARYLACLTGVSQNSVAMQGLLSNNGGAPHLDRMLGTGYDKLLTYDGRLEIYDPALIARERVGKRHDDLIEVAALQDIQAIIQQKVMEESQRGADARPILVVVDSFYDITIRNGSGDEFARQERIVNVLTALARRYRIRMLVTGHINKRVNMRKPSIDYLTGHRMIRYSANVVAFLYTAFIEDRSAEHMTYRVPQSNEVLPVAAITIQKNKAGKSHDTFFVALDSDRSRVIMLNASEQKNYAMLFTG